MYRPVEELYCFCRYSALVTAGCYGRDCFWGVKNVYKFYQSLSYLFIFPTQRNEHLQVSVFVQKVCCVTTVLRLPEPKIPLKYVRVLVVVSVILASK